MGSTTRDRAPPQAREREAALRVFRRFSEVASTVEGAFRVMNTKKNNSRRAPVAVMGRESARRRRLRERRGLLESEPTSEPLSGSMLVLLSRLHRAERPPKDGNEDPS